MNEQNSQPRYENTIPFTNSKNQSFLIKISSEYPEIAKEYAKNLEVELELKSSELTPDLMSLPSGNINQPQIWANNDSIIKAAEPETKDKYLEISIDGFQDKDISLANSIHFWLGHNLLPEIHISEGQKHRTKVHFLGNYFRAEVFVFLNEVTVELVTSNTGNPPWTPVKPNKKYKITQEPNRTVIQIEHSQQQKTYFALQIKAQTEADYRINGKIIAFNPDDVIVIN